MTSMHKRALFSVFVALVVASGQINSIQAQDGNVVFRMGNFDRSSVEFASGTPKQPVSFAVGQSDVPKDWYATQPGVLVSASSSKVSEVGTAPRAITFAIDSLKTDYTL